MSGPRRQLEVGLGLVALATAAWVVFAPFAAAPLPPITDLPFHAANTSILRHYTDPAWHFREQFDVHPIAVPYLSSYALGALFMLALPALTAVKAASGVMLLLVPAGLAVMAHGMKKSPLLGLLGLGVVWGPLSHWGFLNFVGALGLFALCIGATLLVVDRPTPARRVGLALALVAVFFTHIFRFPFAAAAVVGSALVVYPATRRLRPILLPMAPSLGLFAWWLRVRPRELTLESFPVALHPERLKELPGLLVGAFHDPPAPPRAPGSSELLATLAQALGGAHEKAAFDAFVLAVELVAALSALAFFVERRHEGLGRRAWAWGLGVTFIPLACAGVFLGLFLVLPMQIGTWWYVYPREATATAFLVLGAAPDLPRSPWLRAPLALLLALGAVGIGRVVVKNYAQFASQTADFEAVVAQIPQAPKLMYLIFDHGGSTRSTTPFIHLPAYVQATHGGWLSFHFAGFGASPILYRSADEPGAVVPPPFPVRWEWTPNRFQVRAQGAFFDWFLVRSPQAPDVWFKGDPAIVPVTHQGGWWLYRRQ